MYQNSKQVIHSNKAVTALVQEIICDHLLAASFHQSPACVVRLRFELGIWWAPPAVFRQPHQELV